MNGKQTNIHRVQINTKLKLSERLDGHCCAQLTQGGAWPGRAQLYPLLLTGPEEALCSSQSYQHFTAFLRMLVLHDL